MKIIPVLLTAALTISVAQAAPKRLLVVTTTSGFRHTSIPNLEKVITALGKESGDFTVDLVQQPPNQPTAGRGATDEQRAAQEKWQSDLKTALQKLSPDSLKNYDAVVFASTTGELPIPDPQGLLDWIKAGHAFIGIHAASDTFHRWPAYIEMLGGEFNTHGRQVGVECVNVDPAHPANLALGKTWTITQEEIYEFKNYNTNKVHDLLILDKHPQNKAPGHFPVSWCKNYQGGKIFYTSLGHREDIIDTDPALRDRKNSLEITKAFQAHLLGGIRWALGLTDVPENR